MVNNLLQLVGVRRCWKMINRQISCRYYARVCCQTLSCSPMIAARKSQSTPPFLSRPWMWPRSWRLGVEAVSRRSTEQCGLASELVRLGLVSVSSSDGLGLGLASAWIVNASVSGFKVSVSLRSQLKRPRAHPCFWHNCLSSAMP